MAVNKTVALVNEWANFEQKHPDGSLEDFCRYYLAHRQEKIPRGQLVGGVVPPFVDGLLLKIIGRITKLTFFYTNMALRETGLNQMEEFGILFTIKQEVRPKKNEVIFANLFELSSGTDMLARMKKRGLIREYKDTEDKRSKRVEITAKGEKALQESFHQVRKVTSMLMHDLPDDDKELCVHLLKNVEMKFSALWQKHRGKEFDEVYKEVMGRKTAGKEK